MIILSPKEIIYEESISLTKKHLSSRTIAKMTGASSSGILNWLSGHGPRRPNHFDINPALTAYLDGLLLGDGCIPSLSGDTKAVSPRYVQAFALRYKGWATRILNDLSKFGINGTLKPRISGMGSAIIHLQTSRYYEFNFFRQRWYGSEQKHIPQDILIKPTLMLNWFLGDGNYYAKQRKNQIQFFTNSFPLEDIRRLSHTLERIGMTPARYAYQHGYVLCYYQRQATMAFFQYLSGLPHPECFNHKFPK